MSSLSEDTVLSVVQNVFVVAKQKDVPAIKRAVINRFPRASVRVPHALLDLAEMGEEDRLVFGLSQVWRLKQLKQYVASRVFVYGGNRLFGVEDIAEAEGLRNRALAEHDLRGAKYFNELLIELDFIAQSNRARALPDYIQIETTSFCNARCIMCSHYPNGNHGAQHLGGETYQCLADVLAVSHTVSLNGMGEPFCNPHCPDLIDGYASQGNKVVTNTNLSVLTDRIIECINRNFEWLEISCDGATKETYESIRRGLSFDRFYTNLMTLKERCPDVRRHIASVVMRQNVREMPALVELAHEAGASIITFLTLNANIIIGNDADRMVHYPRVLAYYSARALERGRELGIPVIVPNEGEVNRGLTERDIAGELASMDALPLYKSASEELAMRRTAQVVNDYLSNHDEIQRDTVASNVRCSGICDWLLTSSYVDLEGNAAMCCRNQSFHLGNVCDEGNFFSVWNGSFARKLRSIFYSGYLPESCLGCGLVESGNLHDLKVEITSRFYQQAAYKTRQKAVLAELLRDGAST